MSNIDYLEASEKEIANIAEERFAVGNAAKWEIM